MSVRTVEVTVEVTIENYDVSNEQVLELVKMMVEVQPVGDVDDPEVANYSIGDVYIKQS